MERPCVSVSCAAAWAAGVKKRGKVRPAKPRRNAERRVSEYEARGRNLAIKVTLQAKCRAGTTAPLPAFQVARTRAAANTAEFMGHISTNNPGRNPGRAITRFKTLILPARARIVRLRVVSPRISHFRVRRVSPGISRDLRSSKVRMPPFDLNATEKSKPSSDRDR